VAQVVELLLCKCEVLSPNSSPTRKRKKKSYQVFAAIEGLSSIVKIAIKEESQEEV
jgi:hypothetical protein